MSDHIQELLPLLTLSCNNWRRQLVWTWPIYYDLSEVTVVRISTIFCELDTRPDCHVKDKINSGLGWSTDKLCEESCSPVQCTVSICPLVCKELLLASLITRRRVPYLYQSPTSAAPEKPHLHGALVFPGFCPELSKRTQGWDRNTQSRQNHNSLQNRACSSGGGGLAERAESLGFEPWHSTDPMRLHLSLHHSGGGDNLKGRPVWAIQDCLKIINSGIKTTGNQSWW